MNQEKLAKLRACVWIRGKGTVHRNKKVVHRTAIADGKKLQTGIEELNIIKGDGVHPYLFANIFAITGQAEAKQITEKLPEILS
ncbi:hypothetical protein QTO34_000463, partial [Cnephaeus nilssonii]